MERPNDCHSNSDDGGSSSEPSVMRDNLADYAARLCNSSSRQGFDEESFVPPPPPSQIDTNISVSDCSSLATRPEMYHGRSLYPSLLAAEANDDSDDGEDDNLDLSSRCSITKDNHSHLVPPLMPIMDTSGETLKRTNPINQLWESSSSDDTNDATVVDLKNIEQTLKKIGDLAVRDESCRTQIASALSSILGGTDTETSTRQQMSNPFLTDDDDSDDEEGKQSSATLLSNNTSSSHHNTHEVRKEDIKQEMVTLNSIAEAAVVSPQSPGKLTATVEQRTPGRLTTTSTTIGVARAIILTPDETTTTLTATKDDEIKRQLGQLNTLEGVATLTRPGKQLTPEQRKPESLGSTHSAVAAAATSSLGESQSSSRVSLHSVRDDEIKRQLSQLNTVEGVASLSAAATASTQQTIRDGELKRQISQVNTVEGIASIASRHFREQQQQTPEERKLRTLYEQEEASPAGTLAQRMAEFHSTPNNVPLLPPRGRPYGFLDRMGSQSTRENGTPLRTLHYNNHNNSSMMDVSQLSEFDDVEHHLPYSRRNSGPGAFAVRNPAGLHPSQHQQPIPENTLNTQLSDMSVTISTAEGTRDSTQTRGEGLALASPVREVYLDELPSARRVCVDTASSSKRKRSANHETTSVWRIVVCLVGAVVFLVTFSATLLALLLAQEHQEPPVVYTKPKAPEVPQPTLAPTTYESHLLSLLPEETIYFMEENGSAQAKAFDWLLEDIGVNPYMEDRQIQQRFALACLYFATGGETWLHNDHWLEHTVHECSWYNKEDYAMYNQLSVMFPGYLDGFFRSSDPSPSPMEYLPSANVTSHFSRRCDRTGMYEALWLDANNIEGALPEEVFMLTSLRTMSFMYNMLEGTISSSLGKLTSLEGFYHFGLKKAGTLPTQIGLLTNLRGLGLYSAEVTGSIPTELWQLTKLEAINFGDSPLKGSIPSTIGLFSNLKWLHIIDAELAGTIPTELANLSKLAWCALQSNSLSGTIPTQMGELTKMTLLAFWNNTLTGTIPSELGAMTSTTLLTLQDNELVGTIPTEIGLLTHMSELLDFAKNKDIHGTIPTEFGLLLDLEELNLSENSHTGNIPSQLGLLTKLEHVGLNGNSFTGTIPNELSSSQASLYLIEFQGNNMLSGTVPSGLCTINNTCVQSSLKQCQPTPPGLYFNCTDKLGGCGCPVDEPTKEPSGTTFTIIASP